MGRNTSSLVGRLMGRLGKIFLDGDIKKRFATMGSAALLSYGWVSNVNACCLVMLSWVTFARTSGLSPLAPGQWAKFLPVYAGFYLTIGTATRPFRIAAAIAIAPVFDRIINFFKQRFNLPTAAAFAATVFVANVLGTI